MLKVRVNHTVVVNEILVSNTPSCREYVKDVYKLYKPKFCAKSLLLTVLEDKRPLSIPYGSKFYAVQLRGGEQSIVRTSDFLEFILSRMTVVEKWKHVTTYAPDMNADVYTNTMSFYIFHADIDDLNDTYYKVEPEYCIKLVDSKAVCIDKTSDMRLASAGQGEFLTYFPDCEKWFSVRPWFVTRYCAIPATRFVGYLDTSDQPLMNWDAIAMTTADNARRIRFGFAPGCTVIDQSGCSKDYIKKLFNTDTYCIARREYRVRKLTGLSDWRHFAAESGGKIEIFRKQSQLKSICLELKNGLKLISSSPELILLSADGFVVPVSVQHAYRLRFKYCIDPQTRVQIRQKKMKQ